jgi:hypothetical protein
MKAQQLCINLMFRSQLFLLVDKYKLLLILPKSPLMFWDIVDWVPIL